MKFGSVKAFSHEPGGLNQRPAIDGQITSIILGKQQIWIPAGLEPWVRAVPARTYLVVVCVNDVRPVGSAKLKCHLIERMFRQEIANDQKGYKFARRHEQGCLDCECKTLVAA